VSSELRFEPLDCVTYPELALAAMSHHNSRSNESDYLRWQREQGYNPEICMDVETTPEELAKERERELQRQDNLKRYNDAHIDHRPEKKIKDDASKELEWRKQQEETKKKADEARKRADAEARRKMEEQARIRKQQQEEAKKAEEEKRVEAEAKRKADEQARIRQQQEEAKRKADDERKRAEAKRRADEESRIRRQQEYEQRLRDAQKNKTANNTNNNNSYDVKASHTVHDQGQRGTCLAYATATTIRSTIVANFLR
jgi:hypothetical protein